MKTRRYITILLLALSVLLAACGGQAVVPPVATQAAVETTPELPAAAPTAEPTPTPLPGKVLLYAPAGVDPQPYQQLVAELSAAAGWTVETLSELQAAQITPEVKVVVATSVPSSLNEWLSAAPQAQFIVIAGIDMPPAANLTVIRERPEYQVFLSGFVSALLSQDYRAAGLLPSDGPLGEQIAEVFVNGGRYYCGTCAPGWPLNYVYPYAVTSPGATGGAAWQAALAGAFDNQKVDVVYLAPETVLPEVLAYLQGRVQFDRTMVVVGAQPPPQILQSQWAASIRFDDLSALRQVWPDVSAGKGGSLVEAQLVLENVNPNLLGVGRQRLVEELMQEIKSGRIYPYTIAP